MSVIVFRRGYDPHKGIGISWRLHGEALPQGGVPIRFVLDDTPKLKLFDILAVPEGVYHQNLDRITAIGLLDDIIVDLVERPPLFWNEYTRFIAEHLPEAVPLAIKDLSKSKMEKCYLDLLRGLVKAGANINFVLKGKTALDYAVEIRNVIPYKWMSGNRDHVNNAIEALKKAGAITAVETTVSTI